MILTDGLPVGDYKARAKERIRSTMPAPILAIVGMGIPASGSSSSGSSTIGGFVGRVVALGQTQSVSVGHDEFLQ